MAEDKPNKYIINKKALMVKLDNEINKLRKQEETFKEEGAYGEALEACAKAEILHSVIARYLV
jgi:hypothetical protein